MTVGMETAYRIAEEVSKCHILNLMCHPPIRIPTSLIFLDPTRILGHRKLSIRR